jgi:hypothetical protein
VRYKRVSVGLRVTSALGRIQSTHRVLGVSSVFVGGAHLGEGSDLISLLVVRYALANLLDESGDVVPLDSGVRSEVVGELPVLWVRRNGDVCRYERGRSAAGQLARSKVQRDERRGPFVSNALPRVELSSAPLQSLRQSSRKRRRARRTQFTLDENLASLWRRDGPLDELSPLLGDEDGLHSPRRRCGHVARECRKSQTIETLQLVGRGRNKVRCTSESWDQLRSPTCRAPKSKLEADKLRFA